MLLVTSCYSTFRIQGFRDGGLWQDMTNPEQADQTKKHIAGCIKKVKDFRTCLWRNRCFLFYCNPRSSRKCWFGWFAEDIYTDVWWCLEIFLGVLFKPSPTKTCGKTTQENGHPTTIIHMSPGQPPYTGLGRVFWRVKPALLAHFHGVFGHPQPCPRDPITFWEW